MTLPRAWRQLRALETRRRRQLARVRQLVRRNHQQLPPPQIAKTAGLRYVSDSRTPGIRRIGSSIRVRYVEPSGAAVSDPAVVQRIKALAIPPAWTDVWICPDPSGHLQATGRDA